MNYLAHFYLAEQSSQGLVGSLLGDFVKGRLDNRYPETVRRGIALHRAIDSFTDAHPLHLDSRNRISKERRRYAGIIIDVCYDHFLCKHWSKYSDESLADFVARVYNVLGERPGDLPERLQRILPHMIADDWLASYAELENVGRAIDGIARRIPRRNPLAGALLEIESNYAALDGDFQRFFPALNREARRILSTLVPGPGND
jgi:acyl carrier protein phosphodiesterase